MFKATLIILGILLATCLADNPYSHIAGFGEYDELLRKVLKVAAKDKVDNFDDDAAYELIRQSRATITAGGTVKAWVDGDLNSCIQPNSKISTFCSISYATPAIILKRVTKVFEVIVDGFSNLQSQFGTNCANIVKEVVCHGIIPQCSSNRTIATYGRFPTACAGMSSCSSTLININGQTGAQICAGAGRSIDLTTCGKYSVGSFNSQLCGQLPANITFPSWMLPNLPGISATVGSLKVQLERGRVSQDCVNKWVKMICVNAPFCDAARSKALSAVTKQQCQAAIDCLPSNFKTAFNLVYDCAVTYPDQASASVTISNDKGYSGNAISLAMGSAALYIGCLLFSILS